MINRLADRLLALPRVAKRGLALAVDAGLCVLCVWLALALRFEEWGALSGQRWWAVAEAIALALPLFVVSGLYRAIFRYSGAAALMALVRACSWFGVLYFLLIAVVGVHSVPRSVGLMTPLLLFVLVGGSRMLARYWLGGLYVGLLKRKALPQVVIYGAGNAGRQLAAALVSSREMVVRAFVDDAPQLQGRTLNGVQILSPAQLLDGVHERGFTEVLLAMPSVSRGRRAEILRELLPLGLHVRTLPGMVELAQGRVQVGDLHELDIEDLLGRDAVAPVDDLLHRKIRGKVVLVTGAGGSIGSELCRQIVQLAPASLLLLELSEYALYAIHQELQRLAPAIRVLPLLASVQDEARVREIMATWRPHTVYHAAAYKHVPLVEHNPAAGIRNNTWGTLTTALVAAECGVADFVLVSTDKAVRPTNVMGASKRLAEMVLQGLAQQGGDTRFSMVRFGNVLGSSGSVVPLFRRQIKEGGPITLTHRDITRYFMTIPEAAQLVIQAGAMAAGGGVFVLDMGEPVQIIDLARRMVELSGLKVCDADCPDGDIAIEITGLRPGEKLYEELLMGDNAQATRHPRILKAHEACPPWADLQRELTVLRAALDHNNVPAIKRQIQKMVPGYRPSDAVVDWVYLEQHKDVARRAAASRSQDLAPVRVIDYAGEPVAAEALLAS